MSTTRSHLFALLTPAVAVLAAGGLAVGCHNDAQRAEDQRANVIQAHADQTAAQLRAEAERVHDQGAAEADRVRAAADRNLANGTADNSGVVVAPRGGGPGVTAAMQRYAETMCDHAEHCTDIGVGHHWRDRATCVADQRNDRSQSWETAGECTAHGVNAAHLDACLTSVRNDHCGNPIDALSHAAACRAAEVCAR